MSKNFLSKKSWHTASLHNIERVWKAEQRQQDEDKKMTELKRQLAEEQKIHDLKRLHEEATGKKSGDRYVASHWYKTIHYNHLSFHINTISNTSVPSCRSSDSRLEWMYSVKKGPSTEEYLLGKPLTE